MQIAILAKKYAQWRTLSIPSVDALRYLVAESGASIVVSSSWRDLGEYRLRKLWEYNQMPGCLDETTPMTPENILVKEEAIKCWISAHEKDSFVVLDDDPLPVVYSSEIFR